MQLIFKLLILVLLSFPVIAEAPVKKEDAQNPQGLWHSRIFNGTNSQLYCWIGYSEFYVNPDSYSRWYAYSDSWSCSQL